jgi:DNA-binding response OmpR family regulator
MAKTTRLLLFSSAQDDEPILRDALSQAEDLNNHFVLDFCQEYEESITAAVENTHDVFLVSHHLPNCAVDGLEFIERAIAGGCTRPVILITHLQDEDIEWAADEAGAACFLNKQLDLTPRVLKQVIRFSISHFSRLKDIQYKLVRVRAQLSDVCRKLNRG